MSSIVVDKKKVKASKEDKDLQEINQLFMKIEDCFVNKEFQFKFLFERKIEPHQLKDIKHPLVESISLIKHYQFASEYLVKLKDS